MNIAKSDVDGGLFQVKLLDTIRDLKNEMQANAALPAAARGKDGKMGTGLQATYNHFHLYKSLPRRANSVV